MKELIDKYIWKHIRVEGYDVYFDCHDPATFTENIKEIFSLSEFNMYQWCTDNVTDGMETIFGIAEREYFTEDYVYEPLGYETTLMRYKGDDTFYFINGNQVKEKEFYERDNR